MWGPTMTVTQLARQSARRVTVPSPDGKGQRIRILPPEGHGEAWSGDRSGAAK